ncbi:PIG-L deacetylase family protein [Pseudolabrys sp. FHR47]|uniref:PIG-L deacetylase family protein n=1 Tax=Pseudolabrys sp. FHR47 TaxID=2562284 RepID=UPI0010BF0DAE|nr:PIG-L deacetylase family protein [Pseudolabrys sp. FHR47]
MNGAPVLVVAPHALDEMLGCGGTIARHAAAGRKVHILVLCGDGTGLDGKRRDAAMAAAALLGCEPPRFAGFPENRSDTVPIGEVVGAIERTVNELKPATVYVSHGGNLNIDHQTAFRAVATALRPMPGSPVAEFYAYEIASSTDWAPLGFGATFVPNHFVEITAELPRKIQALELYAFDMRPEPHARSIKALENLARARGATVGLAAAEAFMVLREVERY